MDFINKYLRNFTPYKVASHKIWSIPPEKRDSILKLDWNESTIQPSPLVKERLAKLIDEDHFFNLYPETFNAKLIQKLSDYVGLPKENVQYFASSDSLHEYIAKLFISVGDPVLILGPSYDNFRLTSEVNGGRVYFFEYGLDFSFDQEGFVSFLKQIRPSLVYICNPNNPTGNLHSRSFIESLVNSFPDVMFLIDEAYIEFAGLENSSAPLVISHDNLLVSRTMSKAFGLANFRFGYLIASKKNIDYISSIRNPKNITTFAQVAVLAVFDDIQYMENYVKSVNYAKPIFLSKINKISPFLKAYESKGNFVLVKLSTYEIKKSLLSYLEKNNIFVRDLHQSESVRTCIRITIGLEPQMEQVVSCISNFFRRLYKVVPQAFPFPRPRFWQVI
jgi:histidinol-phosphate aminotransferase